MPIFKLTVCPSWMSVLSRIRSRLGLETEYFFYMFR